MPLAPVADQDQQPDHQARLRDYVTGCQKLAKGNAIGLIPRSRRQIWLRNQAIRMLPYMPWRNLVAGGINKAVNAITLRDYPAAR